jgi:hypothetical protein
VASPTKNRSPALEWIGGLVSFPAYVTGEGGPYKPEVLPEDAEDEQSYLGPGIEPPAVASFFRAAAALFRAAPWRVVPGDECVMLVSVDGSASRTQWSR